MKLLCAVIEIRIEIYKPVGLVTKQFSLARMKKLLARIIFHFTLQITNKTMVNAEKNTTLSSFNIYLLSGTVLAYFLQTSGPSRQVVSPRA